MDFLFYVIFFFVGACFVSCGNCIYYRVVHNMNWVSGHSVCECCGKRLAIWELVPVISCVLLRGRCSKCGYYFGYTHAQTETTGGAFVILLCLSKDAVSNYILPTVLFGISYCVFCWLVAKQTIKV